MNIFHDCQRRFETAFFMVFLGISLSRAIELHKRALMAFLKSVIGMKLRVKLLHPVGPLLNESARLDVMPDLIRHP